MQIWTYWQTHLDCLTPSAEALLTDATAPSAAALNCSLLLPLLERSTILLGGLALPLSEIAAYPDSFESLARVLLQQYLQQTQQEPSLADWVGLIGQAVYLDQFKAALTLPKLQSWLQQFGQQPASESVQHALQAVMDLEPHLGTNAEFEDRDARQALINFSTSRLGECCQTALFKRLESLGVKAEAARQIARQLADQTARRLYPALAEAGAHRWLDWYNPADVAALERHLRIDTYLDEVIQPLPEERVLNEPFRFRELYVPLRAQPLLLNGEPDLDRPPVLLEEWAQAVLHDPQKSDRVLFVQGGFGRGKSTFCRMFADWLRQHEHPRWTPILIPLQDVHLIEKNFEELLRKAIARDFTLDDPDWLNHPDTRFLFLLDGFNELHLDSRSNIGLEEFFQQVGKFQESCASHPEMGHRVLLTGRCLLVQTVERLLPPNLERVEILPFDDQLQAQWLSNWQRLTGTDAAGLRQLMHHPHLPERTQNLVREPLLLHSLAAMDRDGDLQLTSLESLSPDQAKVALYQQVVHWALTKQRPNLLERELSLAEIDALRRILAEAGLALVQSGGESIPISLVAQRLHADPDAQTLLQEIQAKLKPSLQNALVVFYRPTHRDDGYIRFTHNSFGKMFCGQRLKEYLEDWSITWSRRQQQDWIPTPVMDGQIFELLGYGGLMPEIAEHLMVLLNGSPEFDLVRLFTRLEHFFLRWCDGQFMDVESETLPQREMRRLRQQAQYLVPLGQRQVDVYAGLNVMILLLQLHGKARSNAALQDTIAFYPCGQQGSDSFDADRLLRVIGYSHCVSPCAFRAIVGPYLSGVNLSGVNLGGVNLSGVNLSDADLRGAILSGANLRGANLSRASLVSASLDGADLSNADLRGANLIGANLRGADLSGADLSGADLSSATLIGASLSRANLRDADLSGAYLRGASLRSADLSRAYLIGASLSGASLCDANLSDVDLSDANLHGADLSNSTLRNANLSGADLIGAYLNGASLCGANLRDASLNSADLIDADLCGADLSHANLIGADLSDQSIGTVRWSEKTKWQDVRGLETAVNVPDALKQQLGLE